MKFFQEEKGITESTHHSIIEDGFIGRNENMCSNYLICDYMIRIKI